MCFLVPGRWRTRKGRDGRKRSKARTYMTGASDGERSTVGELGSVVRGSIWGRVAAARKRATLALDSTTRSRRRMGGEYVCDNRRSFREQQDLELPMAVIQTSFVRRTVIYLCVAILVF